MLRTVDGRWLAMAAAPLEGNGAGQIAIALRVATTSEMLDILCRVHALSIRERQVVALLVAGADTREVAQRLVISPHTVQDHLKSIFEKTRVHSRRELLATLSAAG